VITPRLLRRSFRRALQWRFLLFWLLLVALPTACALFPVWRFLHHHLGHSVLAQRVGGALDSRVVADLVKQLTETRAGNSLEAGAVAGAVVAIFCMPMGAGAALALARAEEPLRFDGLLAAAAQHYGRMFRMLLVALVPLGLAAAGAAGLSRAAAKAAEHAVLESQALRYAQLAAAAAFVLFFVAQATVDAGRAAFATDPQRRSAWLALWSGARLLMRRPWRMMLASAAPLLIASIAAAFVLWLRLRLRQAGPGSLAVAFLLAEVAVAAVGWNRAARLIALTELMRADAAQRARPPRLSIQEPSVT
jgi:hypothetical protein